MTVVDMVVHEIASCLSAWHAEAPKNNQLHRVDEFARVCNLTLGTTHEH